jgi:hypothetical protein
MGRRGVRFRGRSRPHRWKTWSGRRAWHGLPLRCRGSPTAVPPPEQHFGVIGLDRVSLSYPIRSSLEQSAGENLLPAAARISSVAKQGSGRVIEVAFNLTLKIIWCLNAVAGQRSLATSRQTSQRDPPTMRNQTQSNKGAGFVLHENWFASLESKM